MSASCLPGQNHKAQIRTNSARRLPHFSSKNRSHHRGSDHSNHSEHQQPALGHVRPHSAARRHGPVLHHSSFDSFRCKQASSWPPGTSFGGITLFGRQVPTRTGMSSFQSLATAICGPGGHGQPRRRGHRHRHGRSGRASSGCGSPPSSAWRPSSPKPSLPRLYRTPRRSRPPDSAARPTTSRSGSSAARRVRCGLLLGRDHHRARLRRATWCRPTRSRGALLHGLQRPDLRSPASCAPSSSPASSSSAASVASRSFAEKMVPDHGASSTSSASLTIIFTNLDRGDACL